MLGLIRHVDFSTIRTRIIGGSHEQHKQHLLWIVIKTMHEKRIYDGPPRSFSLSWYREWNRFRLTSLVVWRLFKSCCQLNLSDFVTGFRLRRHVGGFRRSLSAAHKRVLYKWYDDRLRYFCGFSVVFHLTVAQLQVFWKWRLTKTELRLLL